jgi:stage II sporulation protein D
VLAVCLAAVCAHSPGQTVPRNTIRVGLWTLWHDKQANIAPLAGATLRLCATCEARPLPELAVRVKDAGLAWTERNGRADAATEMLLAGSYRLAAHGEQLTLDYPLRIAALGGALVLSATLPVERYVELAVAAESGSADGPESRKALAVVARSFALDPAHGHTGFDVCDSTHCQWVRWRTTPEAHAATLATAGESLWFHGNRTGAYFHQNCGGRTAAASEVWPEQSALGRAASGPLVSHTDNYCQRVGSSEWSATLTRAELTGALAGAGLAAPGWKSLSVARRGESGRATLLRVGSTEIPAESFRLAVGRSLGWNRIRSNWFEVAAAGDSFLFHGRGSGHGVGLCQTGAAEMAREGRGYREILAQYFPALAGALADAENRSGLGPRAAVTVRAYRSTPAFRDATLAPGWVAAFTEADSIAVQPLRILAARKLLASVMRHEFLHALVEEQATANTPLWLREGLVEAWSGDAHPSRKPMLTSEQTSQKLAHAANEAVSATAHNAAGWYAAQWLDRYGRATVLEWLRTGVPQSALATLR